MIAYLGLSTGRLYEQPYDGTRPVLVLDPDNAEEMAALDKAYHQALSFPFDPTEALTAAVRSLLPIPAPPVPPEPGMAARVTADGMQWAKSTSGWWWPLTYGESRAYDWEDLCAKYPDLTVEDGDES